MSQFENASIVLNSHPDGAATLENFRLETSLLRPLIQESFWLRTNGYRSISISGHGSIKAPNT